MCGIAGVVSDDPASRADIVRSMLSRIVHRGPDDEGLVNTEHASIGVRRLSIIDLTGGHQPMSNEAGTVFAVHNGELYNFVELRSELEVLGHRFQTKSDTEILPHAYEEWGLQFVSRLRGMFALAIWDEPRRRLVLARDRFGEKPLAYAFTGGGVSFASEIQALLRCPGVQREVDETAIDAYLSLGYIPAPLTAFRCIRKLPPAHTLVADPSGVVIQRYWRLQATPKASISFDDAVSELRSRIDESVRLRLISDVPIGVFLSGGIDSSTVVAFMTRHVPTVRTFTIGFADKSLDEMPHARIVARAFGTQHEELVVAHQDVAVLPDLIRHVGEPFADSSIIPTYFVARITRPHVTVALTGDGGDELFLGYDRYRASLAAALLGRARILTAPLAGVGRVLPGSKWSTLASRFLEGLSLPARERYLRWSGYFTGNLRREIVGERLAPMDELAHDLVSDAYDSGIESEAERYALADVELGLPGDLLVKMDIATMSCSLEARSPFLDHELAQFVARLPASYKVDLRRSKIILRRAMSDILPQEVLHRSKSGFVAPVRSWLRGPLSEMFNDLVLSGEAVRRGWVNGAGISKMVAEHRSGRADRTRHLWSLLVLEIWLRDVG